MAAIRGSKQIMAGHKARLFLLHLRFIGWSLLCLLTCCIGFLFFLPYLATSLACFHNDLRPPARVAQEPLEVQPTGPTGPAAPAGLGGEQGAFGPQAQGPAGPTAGRTTTPP